MVLTISPAMANAFAESAGSDDAKEGAVFGNNFFMGFLPETFSQQYANFARSELRAKIS